MIILRCDRGMGGAVEKAPIILSFDFRYVILSLSQAVGVPADILPRDNKISCSIFSEQISNSEYRCGTEKSVSQKVKEGCL